MICKVTFERDFHPEHGVLPLPAYKTKGAAGLDLPAYEGGTIYPTGILKVSTGLKIMLPEGFEAQVRPRSGLAAKFGVTVLNTPGTIDSDYRGKIEVILINHGTEAFTFKRGDRIAQLVIAPVLQAEIESGIVPSDTDRGVNGFGSTGFV